MPTWKTRVARPSGLIKERGRGGGEMPALKVRLQKYLMKVEIVFQEQISVIDLNHSRIMLTNQQMVPKALYKIFGGICPSQLSL
jgi:hypothetical protein